MRLINLKKDCTMKKRIYEDLLSSEDMIPPTGLRDKLKLHRKAIALYKNYKINQTLYK